MVAGGGLRTSARKKLTEDEEGNVRGGEEVAREDTEDMKEGQDSKRPSSSTNKKKRKRGLPTNTSS